MTFLRSPSWSLGTVTHTHTHTHTHTRWRIFSIFIVWNWPKRCDGQRHHQLEGLVNFVWSKSDRNRENYSSVFECTFSEIECQGTQVSRGQVRCSYLQAAILSRSNHINYRSAWAKYLLQLTFQVQAGTFSRFQAGRSSAMRYLAYDLTALVQRQSTLTFGVGALFVEEEVLQHSEVYCVHQLSDVKLMTLDVHLVRHLTWGEKKRKKKSGQFGMRYVWDTHWDKLGVKKGKAERKKRTKYKKGEFFSIDTSVVPIPSSMQRL